MTKEQEEIINRLSKITNRQILYGNKCGITIEGFRELQEDIDTVLSLIKEQQEEIEGLKNKEVLIKRYFKKCDLIKQKDKQIDLMAYDLADYVMYYEYDKCRNPVMIKNKAEQLKEYYERKARDGRL